MKHAGQIMKTVGGGFVAVDTLCGLLGRSEPVAPEDVTCSKCKRSRAWFSYAESWKEYKECR